MTLIRRHKGCLISVIFFLLISFGGIYFLFSSFMSKWAQKMQPSGIGSLVDIDEEKYKDEYLMKYVDTFFKIYPQYKPVPGDLAKSMTSGYEFLNMTNIYFNKYPRETYCVQWSGTGFVSVRFAYNYEKNEEVIDNPEANAIVPQQEKERMAKRFRFEILDKIDSIISKSKDSVIAIWKPV